MTEQLHLITVIGLKRSGKTSVVEALVSELRARGHEVGTVKTMRHRNVSLDVPGTDTRRHADAGASVVLALGSDGTARLEKGALPASLEEVAGHFPRSIRILVSEGAIDPANPHLVVLCLRESSGLQVTLDIRKVPRSSVAAISGRAASVWDPLQLPGVPSFDVTDPVQKKALADLILGKIAQSERDPG